MQNKTLFVLEGLDGSGKTTQMTLLQQHLRECGKPFRTIKLPDYQHSSSTFVKMYLAGEFGSSPHDVNAYAASLFYSVDRYASYHQRWSQDYLAGVAILADRYATSNAVHQMSKLPKGEWDGYLQWLEELEYRKLGLPRPDLVIYLDMPPSLSQQLMTGRYQGEEGKKDIHESDLHYMEQCREAALYAAGKQGWTVVCCAPEQQLRSIADIQQEIQQTVNKELLVSC